MKTKNILFYLSFIPIIFLFGCNQEKDVEPPQSITIVKFKDPAYTKNVIVWNNDNMEKMVLLRGNKCEHTFWTCFPIYDRDGSSMLGETDEVKFPERYRDPFWALPDGWYLIDWAWCNLKSEAYPYLGYTILTDVTFDNLYEYKSCYFDKSLPHVSLPKDQLYEQKIIRIADLMAYIHPDGKYPSYEFSYYDNHFEKDTVFVAPNQYFFHCWLGGYLPIASNVQTCLCGLADQVDNYWAELQNQLTILIENGDLNHLKHFDTNTLYTDR